VQGQSRRSNGHPRVASDPYLEITVFVDENVGGLEVTVDNACRVDILETAENLVEEVLDKLLLEWPRGEQTVEVGTKELGHKVDVLERGDEDVAEGDNL
jgi:hypothetical protein